MTFRSYVACKVSCKIPKFEFLAFFLNFNFDFVFCWLGIWCESLVWESWGGGWYLRTRRSSCSNFIPHFTGHVTIIHAKAHHTAGKCEYRDISQHQNDLVGLCLSIRGLVLFLDINLRCDFFFNKWNFLILLLRIVCYIVVRKLSLDLFVTHSQVSPPLTSDDNCQI